MSLDTAFFDELEGFFAWDGGAVDSGVKNDTRRAELAAELAAADEDELRLALARWLREESYLSEDALAQGYGPEDAGEFIRWIYDGDYRVR